MHLFLWHILNKNENIINAGFWVLSENRKINSRQEKPICPKIAKITSCKTKKLPICKNKLPQKFCATWYDLPYTGWMLLITIELFKDSWTAGPYTRFKYSETFIKWTPLGPSQVSA